MLVLKKSIVATAMWAVRAKRFQRRNADSAVATVYQFLIQRSCCVAGGLGVGDGAIPAVLHKSNVGL